MILYIRDTYYAGTQYPKWLFFCFKVGDRHTYMIDGYENKPKMLRGAIDAYIGDLSAWLYAGSQAWLSPEENEKAYEKAKAIHLKRGTYIHKSYGMTSMERNRKGKPWKKKRQ